MSSANATGSQATVVVADDHVVVRRGVRALLQAPDLRIVAEAMDLPETWDTVRAYRPDLLIIDLSLRGVFSLQDIPKLVASSPGTRVLVLTMHEDPSFARASLRAGAHGYVLKEAAAEELVAAVRTVLDGGIFLDGALGASLAVGDDHDEATELTERERKVLRLIAVGHTNGEIAGELYLSLRTVEAHRSAIRAKLNLATRAELCAYAREHGLGA